MRGSSRRSESWRADVCRRVVPEHDRGARTARSILGKLPRATPAPQSAQSLTLGRTGGRPGSIVDRFDHSPLGVKARVGNADATCVAVPGCIGDEFRDDLKARGHKIGRSSPLILLRERDLQEAMPHPGKSLNPLVERLSVQLSWSSKSLDIGLRSVQQGRRRPHRAREIRLFARLSS